MVVRDVTQGPAVTGEAEEALPCASLRVAANRPRPGALRAWGQAVRPRTLPAAATPVLVGGALAAADARFAWLPAVACLLGSLLLQIASNLANDYFDHVKGADTPDRLGPPRASAQGWLAPAAVWRATWVVLGLAVLVGAYLVAIGGVPILVIGVAGMCAAVLYTGGPRPLAYIGLGELFVILFFGLAAVAGTYYVQAAAHDVPRLAAFVPAHVWLAAVPVGALIAAILVVNNLRDRYTDAAAGKRTLAVRLGATGTRVEYTALVATAYVVPAGYVALGPGTLGWLLPLASLPFAVVCVRRVWRTDGAALNPLLGATARLGLIWGLLFACGLVGLPPLLEGLGVTEGGAA